MRNVVGLVLILGLSGCGGRTHWERAYGGDNTPLAFQQDKAVCDFMSTAATPTSQFGNPVSAAIDEGLHWRDLMILCMKAQGWRQVKNEG